MEMASQNHLGDPGQENDMCLALLQYLPTVSHN